MRSQSTGQYILNITLLSLNARAVLCHRYIISMAVGDHTGQIWLSGFNDVGTTLFGLTADELHSIRVFFF
jgi:Replication factor-A C terminal domain